MRATAKNNNDLFSRNPEILTSASSPLILQCRSFSRGVNTPYPPSEVELYGDFVVTIRFSFCLRT
jgi:hypothetical protein